MEKYNLIHISGYGDKLNELTSIIYDHIGIFISKMWRWIAAFSIVVGGLLMALPEDYREYWLLSVFVLLLVLAVALVAFAAIMKHSFDGENVARASMRHLLKDVMPQMGMGLVTLTLPCLLIAVVLSLVIVPLLSSVQNDILEFVVLLICLFVMSMCMYPFFQTVNVIAFENLTGMKALRRALWLSTCTPIKTMLYMFTVSVIGLAFSAVPMLINAVIDAFVSALVEERSYSYTDDTDIVELCVMVGIRCLSVAAVLLFILLQSLASMIEYGNAVELRDNVTFLEKYNNFDNL